MVAALTFTDADSNITDLNDGTKFKLVGMRGAGIPPLIHETVKTPSRRGEQYIRTVLEPRFLIIELAVIGTSYADRQTQRRTLINKLNPKVGEGILTWTPVSGGTIYAIDCFVERGLGFGKHLSDTLEFVAISFRCPDPAWYGAAEQSTALAITGGLEIPLKFDAGGGSDSMSISALAESQVLDNTGDLATFPTITIPGAFTNPKITNVTTGKVIHFSGLTVTGGEEFVIDMDAQTAKVDGVSVMDKRTSTSEAWALEPGNNTVKFETSTGQATATVAWFVRYLGV